MERQYKRQLLELEQQRRTINRDTINPQITFDKIGDVDPILTMVAEVRAAYLKALFDLAGNREGIPSAGQIDQLRELRLSYSELVEATNALETAIERGYITLSGATD